MLFPSPRRRKPYPSDLSKSKWEQIESILPDDSDCGRPRYYPLREIVNAINYRWETGCVWRMLPHDFPPWQSVYQYFRRWNRLGLLTPLRKIILKYEPRVRNRSEERPPEMPRETNPIRPQCVPRLRDNRDTSPFPTAE